MPVPTIIFDANQPDPITVRGGIAADAVFTLTSVPIETVLDPGSDGEITVDDAVLDHHDSATVETTAALATLVPYESAVTFESLDTNIATVGATSGLVSWVSDGTARMLAHTTRQSQRINVPVSRVGGQSTDHFDRWVPGSLALHLKEQIDDRIALVSDVPAALPMTSDLIWNGTTLTGSWNPSCWCADVDLSATMLFSSLYGNGKYGTYLVAPDLLLGVGHAGPGGSLWFMNPSGTMFSRTIIDSEVVSGLADTKLRRLDAPLTSGQGFTPLKLLSAQQAQDYMPSMVNLLDQLALPFIQPNQNKKAYLRQVSRVYEVETGYWSMVHGGTSLAAEYDDYFPVTALGDSGHKEAFIIEDKLVVCGTTSGDKFPGQALTAMNASAASMGSIYEVELVDLSNFPSY